MFQYEQEKSQNREKEFQKISSYLKSKNATASNMLTHKKQQSNIDLDLKEKLEQKLGMKLEEIIVRKTSKNTKLSQKPNINNEKHSSEMYEDVQIKPYIKQTKPIILSQDLLQKAEKRYKTNITNDIEIYEDIGLKDAGLNGYTNGKEIHVDGNLSFQERERTILHEIGHIVQLESNMVHGMGIINDSVLEQQADNEFVASKKVIIPKKAQNSIIMEHRIKTINKKPPINDFFKKQGYANSCWLTMAAYCINTINNTKISEKTLGKILGVNPNCQGSAVEAIIKYYEIRGVTLDNEEICRDDHTLLSKDEIVTYFTNQNLEYRRPLLCFVSDKSISKVPPKKPRKTSYKTKDGNEGHWIAIIDISDNQQTLLVADPEYTDFIQVPYDPVKYERNDNEVLYWYNTTYLDEVPKLQEMNRFFPIM